MVAPAERNLLEETLEHRAEEAEQELRDGDRPESRRRLGEIREALRRLGSGTYGFCEACFLTIPWGELISRPERRRCGRCATAR
jgi:RNA polymerase-binding transcription factor DksA